jgi:excisionase family DNA binding protein
LLNYPQDKVYLEKRVAENKLGAVLTVEEISIYLKIPRSTIYKLVREGKIPTQKIGRHWRFRKEAIDNWLEKKQS